MAEYQLKMAASWNSRNVASGRRSLSKKKVQADERQAAILDTYVVDFNLELCYSFFIETCVTEELVNPIIKDNNKVFDHGSSLVGSTQNTPQNM